MIVSKPLTVRYGSDDGGAYGKAAPTSSNIPDDGQRHDDDDEETATTSWHFFHYIHACMCKR